MISRSAKVLFYAVAGPAMRVNATLYRQFRAPSAANRTNPVRVHLGPGQQKYLTGWINVDANVVTARCDVWADLRGPLPFRDGSVDAFYSHHVIEHLPDSILPFHFREMHRCLRPGGVFRVGGPNAEGAARKLLEGDAAWFHDFPDRRESVGGRFANFLLCRGEHLTLLTPSYLREIATSAGFPDLVQRRPVTETGFPEMFDAAVLGQEWGTTSEIPQTLLVEGRRP